MVLGLDLLAGMATEGDCAAFLLPGADFAFLVLEDPD
jgi:hypothetical protein